MARTFNGTTAKAVCSLGGVGQLTAMSLAFIANLTAGAESHTVINVGTNFVPEFYFAASTMHVFNGTADRQCLATGKVTGWALYAVTKAAGTTTPRFHRYEYGTNTWTHIDSNNGTLADVTAAPTTSITLMAEPAAQFTPGDLAVAGIWAAALTDAQVELLPFSLAAWFAPAQPKALWTLDQDVTTQKILDMTGGGANESSLTSTTVATASVPEFDQLMQLAGAVL